MTITAPQGWIDRLAPYREELPSFLLVAALALRAGADGAEPRVTVARTRWPRCERCWTHRSDVASGGEAEGLCGRCLAAIKASDRTAGH